MSVHERLLTQGFTGAAAEAWVTVVVAGEHLTQGAEEVFRRNGVTGDQYNVLRILRGAMPGGLARGEITRRMMRRAPDMTRMLDRLERGGLVERGRGTDDARRSVARITPAGRSLLQRVDPELEQAMLAATSALKTAELRELARLCGQLL